MRLHAPLAAWARPGVANSTIDRAAPSNTVRLPTSPPAEREVKHIKTRWHSGDEHTSVTHLQRGWPGPSPPPTAESAGARMRLAASSRAPDRGAVRGHPVDGGPGVTKKRPPTRTLPRETAKARLLDAFNAMMRNRAKQSMRRLR